MHRFISHGSIDGGPDAKHMDRPPSPYRRTRREPSRRESMSSYDYLIVGGGMTA